MERAIMDGTLEASTIEVTERARRELARILEDKPGSALRLFIEGYG